VTDQALRPSKYDALADRLREQAGEEITLTMDQIDEIVDGLPPMARRDRRFWINTWSGTNVQARGWMPVDWRVDEVDLDQGLVRFIRTSSDRWQDRVWQRRRRTGTQYAWLVRATTQGGDPVADWLKGGYCAIATPGLRRLPPTVTRQEIAERVAEDYGHLGYGARAALVATVNTFLNVMQVGDLVVTLGGDKGEDVYVGTLTGDPVEAEDAEGLTIRQRSVSWANATRPLARDELPEPLQAKLKGQRTITELTPELEQLRRLAGIRPADQDQPTPPQAAELRLPDASDELARRLLLPRPWLQEIIELLWERKQVIFHGPPGTGKTYVARRLAEHVAGVDKVRLVQFHPTYSYEDFFEGFRPRPGDAKGQQIVFELVHGPFRQLVEQARTDPASPYVLVIDEINRAHPAKVFGELYFLLEYRNEPIQLLYSSDEADFRLPENVFLIGTMNTADRSIALVDVAMRRRFAFQEFHPNRPPISNLLRDWLRREGLPAHVAELLDLLNQRIDDPDFAIGPSYLMHPRVATDEGLRRTWQTMLLPLLGELYYGQGRDIEQEFGLTALRESLPDVGQGSAAPREP
jgi:5-methylcytosine-specific restriction enzyme B